MRGCRTHISSHVLPAARLLPGRPYTQLSPWRERGTCHWNEIPFVRTRKTHCHHTSCTKRHAPMYWCQPRMRYRPPDTSKKAILALRTQSTPHTTAHRRLTGKRSRCGRSCQWPSLTLPVPRHCRLQRRSMRGNNTAHGTPHRPLPTESKRTERVRRTVGGSLARAASDDTRARRLPLCRASRCRSLESVPVAVAPATGRRLATSPR